MKTRHILFIILHVCFSSFSTAAFADEKPLSEREIIELLGSFSTVKRSTSLPFENIISATHIGNELELHFRLPLGTAKLSIYSCGELIYNEEYNITDYSTLIRIHLEGYIEDQSSIEIILDNGYMHGKF